MGDGFGVLVALILCCCFDQSCSLQNKMVRSYIHTGSEDSNVSKPYCLGLHSRCHDIYVVTRLRMLIGSALPSNMSMTLPTPSLSPNTIILSLTI